MAIDISRNDFDPRKHYSGVRMQQGRVLMDDDWNENERIEGENKRRSIVDIIGPYGSPDEGFLIKNPQRLPDGTIDFDISNGTVYLGGLQLEMDTIEKFSLQQDWLQQPSHPAPMLSQDAIRYDLAYIEAWQQAVGAVEDSALREVALGGPDTTARIRNMRRVKLHTVQSSDCRRAWEELKTALSTTGSSINEEHELITDTRLRIEFDPSGLTDDLCSPSSNGGYLGAENQAIRIQIKSPSTFTWGIDNASELYRAEYDAVSGEFKLLNHPKDEFQGPRANKVVEILPWSAVLSNGEKIAEIDGHLSRVATFRQAQNDLYFTLLTSLPASFGAEWSTRSDQSSLAASGSYFFVRIWDRMEDSSSAASIPFTSGVPVPLGNTGLLAVISGTQLNPGDFWVVATRPETPKTLVPWGFSQSPGLPPMGIRRFYAPLAIIRWSLDANNALQGVVLHDCRIPFAPLTKRCTCITAVPGPNWYRIFDRYRDGEDICVCFQNGVYELDNTIIIANKGNIKFTGCGKGSKIIVTGSESAFTFDRCKDILIKDLAVESRTSSVPPSGRSFQEDDNRPIQLEGLNGVISIRDCEKTIIENLTAICKGVTDFDRRQATCITVIEGKNKNLRANDVYSTTSITNSSFLVGEKQTGVLIVNTAKTAINDNHFSSYSSDNKGTVSNQGIVVAGTGVREVHVKNNTLKSFSQGIHIGTSRRSNNKIKIKSSIVNIVCNTIECVLRPTDYRERHGIFIGNCESLTVSENFVRLERRGFDREDNNLLPMNGIRIYGRLGRKLLVRDNYLTGFGYSVRGEGREGARNIGIFITYQNIPAMPRWWILEANVVERISIKGDHRVIWPFKTPRMINADGMDFVEGS